MLTLPIEKKWFDMILSGKKKEEYRALSKYYQTRFNNIFDALDTDIKEIAFRNGYSSNSPLFVAKCTLHIKTGNPEWGAEPGKEYYTLKIHEITKNDKESEE